MKFRGPPLWLVCDVFCWLGVAVSFISFSLSFAAVVSAMLAGRRRMKHDELASLARLQAEQEAWLSYAITRRSFRLAGLEASCVRMPDLTPARTVRALKHRAIQSVRNVTRVDHITRRRAERLKRIMATPALSLPRAGEAQRSLLDQHANSGGGPAYLRATIREPTATLVPHPTALAETPALASLPRSGEGVRKHPNFRPTTRLRAGLRVHAPPWRAITIPKTKTRALLIPQRGRGRLC